MLPFFSPDLKLLLTNEQVSEKDVLHNSLLKIFTK